MYMKDKVKTVAIRLNEEQFEFLKATANQVGTSPSKFLRMLIQVAQANVKSSAENAEKALKEVRMRENK